MNNVAVNGSKKKKLQLPFRLMQVDWVLFVVVAMLSVIGLVFSYSSQILIYEGKINPYNNYVRQTLYFFSGMAIMLGIGFTNYRKLCENIHIIYFVAVSLLLYTLIAGTIVNSSKRWISLGLFSVQPSEFVKVVIILLVGVGLEKIQNHKNYAWQILKIFVMVAVPFILIIMQPDLGTALIFLPISLVMLAMLGINGVVFSCVLAAGGCFTAFIFLMIKGQSEALPSELLLILSSRSNVALFAMGLGFAAMALFLFNLRYKNKFLQILALILVSLCAAMVLAVFADTMVLKPYQKERLLAFLDPGSHKKDLGYNVLQSQIAIGSGGVWGKGLFNGVQGQLGFLPSRTNDFIFSVVGEELGFLGSSFIMLLFFIMLYRIARIAALAKDYLGGMLVMGVFAMFAFQILINIGMTVGMMPATGIPLPFLSTGGSTLWTCLIAVGLVFSVNARRYVNN